MPVPPSSPNKGASTAQCGYTAAGRGRLLANHTPRHNPARGAKFLVFGLVVGVIALLRQVGIDPGSPIGLGIIGLAVVALAVLLRWALARWW